MRPLSTLTKILTWAVLSVATARGAGLADQLREQFVNGPEELRHLAVTRLTYLDALNPEQMIALSGQVATNPHGLILECRAYYRLQQSLPARDRCQRAVELARAQANPAALSQALRLLSLLEADGGDPVGAVPRYREALRIAIERNDILQQALVLNNLGIAAHQSGATSESSTYYAQVLALVSDRREPGLRAIVNANLGFLHREVDELAAAQERLQEALPDAQAAQNEQVVLMIQAALADVLLGNNQTAAAGALIDVVLAPRDPPLDDRFLSEAHRVAGVIAAAQGQFKLAESYFRNSLQKAAATPFRVARARKALIALLVKIRRLNEAMREADILIASSAQYRSTHAEGLLLKSSVFAALGRYEDAYKYRLRGDAAEAIQAQDRDNSRLGFLRAQLDADLKDREIQSLQIRERAAQSAIQSERAARNWTVVAAVLAACLGVLAWRLWIRRHDVRARHELEKEVARRALELEAQLQARRRLEQELEHRHRLESIGRLTGGIAHDYNNLMTIVQQSCDLLRRRPALTSDSAAQDLIGECLHASQAAGSISRQLVAFARQQTLQPAPTDLSEFLGGVRALLERAVGADRGLRIEADSELRALVDPGPLTAALVNLISNARDATRQGDVVTIRAAARSVAETDVATPQLAPGRYVELCVVDYGHGMSGAVLERCIEPFFTTKPGASGTGLGLSMVHGMATQSGGDLRLQSRPGEGTTATLLLPAA